eukprot:60120_1
MTEMQDYGSATEDDPLVSKTRSMMSMSRLPMVIGLDNADFRAAVFGIILTTWLIPSFLAEIVYLADNGCKNKHFCDSFLVSYILISLAMGFYKWMFMYVWYKDFSDDAQSNKCITLLKYTCGILLFIGGITLAVAVGNALDDLCMIQSNYCRAGTFGIFLFPILLIFALSGDILLFRHEIGGRIRMRCAVCSGIIFISSLLITCDLFGSDTSFNTVTMGIYQVGWLFTCIVSFFIYFYVALGWYKKLKQTNLKAFYGVSYVFLSLFIGPTITLISQKGYMDVSRTTFVVLGLCAILNVELFLL